MSGWILKTTKEIENEAKAVMFDDDAEEETLKNYELIRDSTYKEALLAYENYDYRNAFFCFTQYLHLASQLSKMLRTEEGDNEQFAEFMADDLKQELDDDFKALEELATEDIPQPSSSQKVIPSTSKVQNIRNRGRHSSEIIQKTNLEDSLKSEDSLEHDDSLKSEDSLEYTYTTKNRSRSQSAPVPPHNAILDTLTADELKIKLKEFNLRDISNPLCDIVQKAVSLYKGDCSKRPSYNIADAHNQKLGTIETVEIVVNPQVSRIYELKKIEYQSSGVKFEEVFAYHGTQLKNAESIKKKNLDPERTVRDLHGRGCYFSEYPEVSHSYAQKCMFIFKLLLVEGKYTKVMPGTGGYCQMLVLTDKSHFKPEYVLYF